MKHTINFFISLQTIGGIDKKLYNGDIHYVPIKRRAYYEIVIGDIKINDNSLGLDCKEVIN